MKNIVLLEARGTFSPASILVCLVVFVTVLVFRRLSKRFDANDFCEAQCDFLQKVHFHCLVEDCGALFRTVDGAIKHAK